MEEAAVVGFEAPSAKLIGWLVKGRTDRTVIYVVAMGGQGKTTLAKKVFDSKEVTSHFNCRAWITVSQSYTEVGLLRDMLLQFHKQAGTSPPKDISGTDRGSLVEEVRNYLRQKRYMIVFDDVWNIHFWNDIQHSKIEQRKLLKSVGMLQNLETLDLRETDFYEIPKEISKLGQLRHLLGSKMSLIQLKGDIGGMTLLQTLWFVDLGGDGAVELIREVGKLKQMRKLGLLRVEGEHRSILSSSINEMQHLEKLHIANKIPRDEEVLDLNFISSPPMLRDLRLIAKLEKLPKWIPKLQNLVKLTLAFSHITNDLMKSLGNMQNLLSLSISQDAYKGECLHFQDVSSRRKPRRNKRWASRCNSF